MAEALPRRLVALQKAGYGFRRFGSVGSFAAGKRQESRAKRNGATNDGETLNRVAPRFVRPDDVGVIGTRLG